MTANEKNAMIDEVQSLIDEQLPATNDSLVTGEALNIVLNAIIEIL